MDCLLSCLHALSAQIFEMEGLQISCLLKPNWPQPLRQSGDKQASSWRRASCHKGQNRHFLIIVSSTSQSWSKCPVISKSFKCCFVPCCIQVLMTPVAIPTHGFNCLRFIFFAFFRMGDLSFPHVVHRHNRSNGLHVLSDSNAIPNLNLCHVLKGWVLHRSHFGSRYTLGCCSHAGLFGEISSNLTSPQSEENERSSLTAIPRRMHRISFDLRS